MGSTSTVRTVEVGIYPLDWLSHLRLSPDGRYVAAWSGKTLLLFTSDSELVAEVEFSRNVTDTAFVGGDELMVAAGKLVRLGIN